MKWWGMAAAGVLVLGGCAPAGTSEAAKSVVKETATGLGTQVTHGWASQSPPTRPEDSGRLVDDARWVERDGVRALVVTPSRALRGQTSETVFDEAWRRVVTAVPEADSPGMRDQFVCHASFAPDKEGWYLEPARPAVGYWATVEAGCNPGDVTDVG